MYILSLSTEYLVQWKIVNNKLGMASHGAVTKPATMSWKETFSCSTQQTRTQHLHQFQRHIKSHCRRQQPCYTKPQLQYPNIQRCHSLPPAQDPLHVLRIPQVLAGTWRSGGTAPHFNVSIRWK
jgi:hypothetical protein